MSRRVLSVVVLAGMVRLLADTANATVDKTMSFSKPTNTADSTVKVIFDPGVDVPVTIPPNTSAEGKRNLIKAELIAKGYDVTDNGPGGNQLTVKFLANGTTVGFDAGNTGEKKDDVLSVAAVLGDMNYVGMFEPFDYEGLPAVFTAGIVTDVGELTVQVSAEELNFDTDGPIICQALFQRLAPRAPQYGAQINYAGDRLEVYFDPAYTLAPSGISFGTTSPSEGCSGQLLAAGGPDPCPGDIDHDGDVDLDDLSVVLVAFGTVEGDPNYTHIADLDGDGDVDLDDLSTVLAHFGEGCD